MRAAVLGVLLLVAVPAVARADPDWTVEQAPFRLLFREGGRILTSQATGAPGAGTRMTYTLQDGSVHSLGALLAERPIAGGMAYEVGTDEPERTATVSVTRTARGVRVEWIVSPADGVVTIHEALAAGTTEHFLGSGARSGFVDLKGRTAPLRVLFQPAFLRGRCGDASSMPMPFFLSTAGYGVFVDSTSVGRLAFPGAREEPESLFCRPDPTPCAVGSFDDRTRICVEAPSLSYEVYSGRPAAVVEAYTAAVGHPPLPPPAQFGLVKWRDAVASGAELLEDVDAFRAAGIPITSVLLDNPWETNGCVGSLEFDRKLGDPRALVEEVHARGVRFALWVAPFVRAGRGCPPPDYPEGSFVEGRAAWDAVPRPLSFLLGARDLDLDLTSRATFGRFKEKLKAVFRFGVDGVKGDRGDETDFEGSNGIHNIRPELYAQAVVEALREVRAEQGRDPGDFTTMFRAGFTGSQSIVHGVWAGDQVMSFEGLRQAIRMGLSAGVSGYPVWGSDVGGYSGGVLSDLASGSRPFLTDRAAPSPELLVRWGQLGAISPILEVGGRGRQQTLWRDYEPGVVELFRRFAVLHYELFPWHYALAQHAAATGVPILRPLGFEFPYDEEAWRRDLEVMVGPDLLAVPVTVDGPAPTVDVYLPPGEWIDLYRGEPLRGPATIARRTPLEEMPLYLRRGAAIPFNLRAPDVWPEPWRAGDLDRPGRASWVYAPGKGEAVSEFPFGGTLRAATSGRRLTLQVVGAPREVQILVLTDAKPEAVAIDGRALPEATSLDALRAARSGWVFCGGPFARGVVAKLAPTEGTARARIWLGL
jgi:alpha-D-xyloside xylohydrolase